MVFWFLVEEGFGASNEFDDTLGRQFICSYGFTWSRIRLRSSSELKLMVILPFPLGFRLRATLEPKKALRVFWAAL